MVKRRVMVMILYGVILNISLAKAEAEVITKNVVGCKNWEYLMEVIWLTSLNENGARYVLPKNVSADEWINSERCVWFTKGTLVTIVDTLPLQTIQLHPFGSMREYILPADALMPSSN
jgi:hypothetical protein